MPLVKAHSQGSSTGRAQYQLCLGWKRGLTRTGDGRVPKITVSFDETDHIPGESLMAGTSGSGS